MPANSSRPIVALVQQHADEAAILRNMRSALVVAPHATLEHVRRLDDRLDAHLDGLAVAGNCGWRVCESALATPGVGEVFAATVRAIEDRNVKGIERMLALGEAAPESLPGLVSAFGWTSAQNLQGTIKNLLGSDTAFHRYVGIAACGVHVVNPGVALDSALADSDPRLRARALRVAGGCGRAELLTACVKSLADADPACQFWAAWSAVLLGDRNKALEGVARVALTAGAHRDRAFRFALQAMAPNVGRGALRRLAETPGALRRVIEGSGIVGDSAYVPWLIDQMADDTVSRAAGEAFSLITGADLAVLDLERSTPEQVESGPSDDPDDPNVALDPDEGLPWPDPARVERWWAANQAPFAAGTRYFVGAPVTRAHCLAVLKNGYQRQRVLAAHHLCLIEPGTPLFNTRAPAWRQQRLLAKIA